VDAERFLELMKEVNANEPWQAIPTDRPYGSADAMFKAELGITYAEAMGLIVRWTRELRQVAMRESCSYMRHGNRSSQ
jgi:hypothetical protein